MALYLQIKVGVGWDLGDPNSLNPLHGSPPQSNERPRYLVNFCFHRLAWASKDLLAELLKPTTLTTATGTG